MTTTTTSAANSINEAVETLEEWAKAAPETVSTAAGVGTIVAGVVALNAAPVAVITGSLIYTFYTAGSTVQKGLLKYLRK